MIPANFSTTLRYQATGDPDTLLADIAELRRRSEAIRGRRWTLVLCLVLWIGFGAAVAAAGGGGVFVFLAVVWAVGGLILYSVLDQRLARHVLEVRRLKTAKALVRALGCDLAPGDPITLAIQFGEYHDPPFRTESAGPGFTYLHPWLAAEGRLADGTRFEVGIDLHARRKVKAKRKGRNKTKEDLCEHVRVVLRPDALPTGADQVWPTRVRRASLPGTAHVHKAEVKKGRVILVVRTARHVRVTDKGVVLVGKDIESRLCGPHHVLKPLLAAYGALVAKGA